MKLDPLILKAMKKAGITADLVLAFVEEYEDLSAEKRAETREQNRIRQQNHRARNAMSRVTERDERDTPSDKEIPQTPKEITTPHSPPKGGSYTPRQELEAVLDAERADALLEHRQRIRKPLTARAAKLMAGKLARTPDPNAAADAIIANGWQGFEPEWMEGRSSARSTGPPGNSAMSAYDEIARARGWTLDEPTILPSNHADAQRLPPGADSRQEGVVVELRRGPDGNFGSGNR